MHPEEEPVFTDVGSRSLLVRAISRATQQTPATESSAQRLNTTSPVVFIDSLRCPVFRSKLEWSLVMAGKIHDSRLTHGSRKRINTVMAYPMHTILLS